MKHTTTKIIALMTLAIALFASCASTQTPGLSKAEKKRLQAEKVRQALYDRHFTINVTSAHPTSFPPVNLTSPYSLEVRGDSVISYLPYYGRAYSVPYGGGKALNFSGKMSGFDLSRTKKEYNIKLAIENDEDKYLYYIDVFDNGHAFILVAPQNRTDILFYGEME